MKEQKEHKKFWYDQEVWRKTTKVILVVTTLLIAIWFVVLIIRGT